MSQKRHLVAEIRKAFVLLAGESIEMAIVLEQATQKRQSHLVALPVKPVEWIWLLRVSEHC
jgi:hypothetical protein